jgi:hypothetical protein
MIMQRPKLVAVLLAAATAFAGEAFAQAARSDPTAPPTRGPSTTAPASSKASSGDRAPSTESGSAARREARDPTAPRGDALAPGTGAGTVSGGVPAIGGVTPNRAELPGSAFTKLDVGSKGYVTMEDVRQLDGFDSAFRQADQNGDGRLNASEFNSAWGAFTGNVR